MEAVIPAIPSGAQWRVEAAGHSAVVVEVGGGLRAYDVAGVSIVDGYGESEICPGSAGQVLAPWPNRIRDGWYEFNGESYQLPLTEASRHNAIHGLVNWVRWSRVAASDGSVTVEAMLVPQPGYPWPLRIRTTWSVGEGGLTAAHEATNLGAGPAPFGFGAHPYVRVPGTRADDVVLHLPAEHRLLADGRYLPIGEARVAGGEHDFSQPRQVGGLVLDSAYCGGGRSVILSNVDGTGRIEVWADEAFRWWQLFSGDTLAPARARRSIAVEPMTCPPDAFRSGRDLAVLEPGQTWRGTWGIRPILSGI